MRALQCVKTYKPRTAAGTGLLSKNRKIGQATYGYHSANFLAWLFFIAKLQEKMKVSRQTLLLWLPNSLMFAPKKKIETPKLSGTKTKTICIRVCRLSTIFVNFCDSSSDSISQRVAQVGLP